MGAPSPFSKAIFAGGELIGGEEWRLCRRCFSQTGSERPFHHRFPDLGYHFISAALAAKLMVDG